LLKSIAHSISKISLNSSASIPAYISLLLILALSGAVVFISSCNNDILPETRTGEDEKTYITTAPTSPGEKYFIRIENNTFEPESITINLNDTVTWINEDSTNHSIVSMYHFQDEDDVSHIFLGEIWVSGDIPPGQSFTRLFKETGVFEYIALPLTVRTPMEQYYLFSLVGVGVVTVN